MRPFLRTCDHERPRRNCGELLAVRLGWVLVAAVEMTDGAFGRSLPLRGHHQGGQQQFGAHVVAHRPACDLAGRQVEHASETATLRWSRYRRYRTTRCGSAPPRRTPTSTGSARSADSGGCRSYRALTCDLRAREYRAAASAAQYAPGLPSCLLHEARHAF